MFLKLGTNPYLYFTQVRHFTFISIRIQNLGNCLDMLVKNCFFFGGYGGGLY